MFEKLSDSSRRVLFHAGHRAQLAGSAHVGAEHLLLGLLVAGDEQVAEVLERAGVSGPSLVARLETAVASSEPSQGATGQGEPASYAEVLLHESTREALNLAAEEAAALGHGVVEAPHLLLGLLRLEESTAGALLREAGARAADVRQHLATPRDE